MVVGVFAVVLAAVLGFTGYPPATASASTSVGLAANPTLAVARFAEPAQVLAPVQAPAKKRIAPLVRARTRWRTARCSWYGPGFYGNTMAGGGALRRTSMIVAHKTLPFGTKIQFSYHGRKVIAVVRDRGPYVSGREFDLGPGTAHSLKFGGVGRVRWRIIH